MKSFIATLTIVTLAPVFIVVFFVRVAWEGIKIGWKLGEEYFDWME